jgi:hypothetical protein
VALESRAERLSLTVAQRHVIDDDEIAWHGWDASRLPVISGPQWPESRAIDRDGTPVEITHPVGGRDT